MLFANTIYTITGGAVSADQAAVVIQHVASAIRPVSSIFGRLGELYLASRR